MHDPAHKEKMQQMMNDPAHKEKMQQKMGGASGHNHTTVKEQKDWGIAGDPAQVSRTIQIAMTDDMKFTPNAISVKQGETVRFVVANKGKVLHEMVIGTQKELKDHAEMMKKNPNMEHDEPYMAHADPGKSESITWLFNRPGQFQFACLVPGHYEAGMRGTITVKP
jgi:uncharacterized cupredoxin-like copper-binding protein